VGRGFGDCVMSCGGEEDKQWSCGKAGAVNLLKVSSIVRDIGEPCLSQSPIKVVIAVRLSSTTFFVSVCSLSALYSCALLNSIMLLVMSFVVAS